MIGSPPRAWGPLEASERRRLRRHGSPPRAWGQRGASGSARPSGIPRFTPTRVGTTARPSARNSTTCGSPPRAWGPPPALGPELDRVRFTPTRVGTTIALPAAIIAADRGSPPRAWGPRAMKRSRSSAFSVHPHARGDHSPYGAPDHACCGSPPRTWGPRWHARPNARSAFGSPPRAWGPRSPGRQESRPSARFTPTRVGTTWRPSSRQSALIGSPPRAWGHPDAQRASHRTAVHPTRVGDHVCAQSGRHRCRRRFTPTPVGTSYSRPTRVGTTTGLGGSGSPPRAWGPPAKVGGRKPLPVHPHARGDHAPSVSRPCQCTVHPHARGDHALLQRGAESEFGSPPTRVGTTEQIYRRVSEFRGSPPRAWGPHWHAVPGWRACPVHPPRAWGPRGRRGRHAGSPSGSPPRAWGPRQVATVKSLQPRFTPTRVGDHSTGPTSHVPRRFTPTRVGTTSVCAGPPGDPAVHPPRAWGPRCVARAFETALGSPPRAWGPRRGHIRCRIVASVHPHARGDDRRLRPAHSAQPVHPHACGDQPGAQAISCRCVGSPPRTWGRLVERSRPSAASVHPHTRGDTTPWRRPRRSWRFTPTRVGTTRACPAADPVHGSPPRAWGRRKRVSRAWR